MRDGLDILNSRNCGKGEYPRFKMGNLQHWWPRYLECKDPPCSAGLPAIAGGMGRPGCTQARRPPTQTDCQDAGMDL